MPDDLQAVKLFAAIYILKQLLKLCNVLVKHWCLKENSLNTPN